MIVNGGDAIVKTNAPAQADAGKTIYRKSGPIGQTLLGFETRYGEVQRKAAEAKAKRKAGKRQSKDTEC